MYALSCVFKTMSFVSHIFLKLFFLHFLEAKEQVTTTLKMRKLNYLPTRAYNWNDLSHIV